MNKDNRRRIAEHFKQVYQIELTNHDFTIIAAGKVVGYKRPADVMTACANAFGLPKDLLMSNRSDREVVYAAAAASFFMYNFSKYTTPAIGRILNRTHSTIIYRLQMVKDLMKYSDFSECFQRAAWYMDINENELNKYLTDNK
jgi:chromosomal replication initiation ATPase DnaA